MARFPGFQVGKSVARRLTPHSELLPMAHEYFLSYHFLKHKVNDAYQRFSVGLLCADTVLCTG